MQSINSIIVTLTDSLGISIESIANQLGVSSISVQRWREGASKPRPGVEAKLREIFVSLSSSSTASLPQPSLDLGLTQSESDIRKAVDISLGMLREVLHRRGRLSSRQEALDEISKLIFAHVMSIKAGKLGISMQSLQHEKGDGDQLAYSLKHFVADQFNRYLPASLSHEMGPSDFALRIKANESAFARDIITCFEHLSDTFNRLSANSYLDILNDVFGKFLADSFIDEKELGQYLTPTEVVRFIVKIAISSLSKEDLSLLCHPEKCFQFGKILDPSCGVGSFLSELLHVLLPMVKFEHGAEGAEIWIHNMVTHVIVGIDKSERMIRLALTNMSLLGIPVAKLHLANALTKTDHDSEITNSLNGTVRLILTNPPFGAEFHKRDLDGYKISSTWATRPVDSVVSEVLFVERYIDWLMPTGQFLTIIPDSILTNRGIYEDLRCNISSLADIISVVSLPSVTFGSAGTTTKTSILHIRKRDCEEVKDSSSYFAICHDIGYSVSSRGAHRTKIHSGNGDLPTILAEFVEKSAEPMIGRIVNNATTNVRWDAGYHASLPRNIEQRLLHPQPSDVLLKTVASISYERVDPRRWGKSKFDYIEISDIDPMQLNVRSKTVACEEAPSRARKLVRAGDILISTVRPERRTVGVVRDDLDGAVCTTGLAVLRPTDIDPFVLAQLIQTDFVTTQILRHCSGIAYPAIEEACLLELLLPASASVLAKLADDVKRVVTLEKELHEARKGLQSSIYDATQKWALGDH